MNVFRSMFNMLFGPSTKPTKTDYASLQLLNGYNSQFTSFNGQIYQTMRVRQCIDAIARNGAKLTPKHIRTNSKKFEELDKRISRLISKQPNEIDNSYNFYYKVISQLFLYNNAFIYIRRDARGVPDGLYPILGNSYKLLEYGGNIYIQFMFNNGSKYVASLRDDVIHLKRFYCEHEVIGDSNQPITNAMSIKHVLDEGIVNAIKTTQSIKGYIKSTKAMLDPKDVKEMADKFISDFATSKGIAGLDATLDFQPISIDPKTASDKQIDDINNDIYAYFGISQEIVQSKYDENQWNAFYESVIEPIAIQMSQEFTNKLFTITEQYHGNSIVFEANKLQYASNQTKIQVAQYLNNYLTINEIREIFNLAPVEGGEARMNDLNHISSDIANEYQISNLKGGKDDAKTKS